LNGSPFNERDIADASSKLQAKTRLGFGGTGSEEQRISPKMQVASKRA